MTTDTAAGMLRGALLPTLATGAICAAVAGVAAGTDGVVGAVIGLALVVVFFGLGLLILGRSVRLEPVLVLLVALGLYAAKVVLIGGSLLLIDASGLLDGIADSMALGVTAILCTLAWTTGQIVGAARSRLPLYDLGRTDDHEGVGS
jgi:ATP synthase protein I